MNSLRKLSILILTSLFLTLSACAKEAEVAEVTTSSPSLKQTATQKIVTEGEQGAIVEVAAKEEVSKQEVVKQEVVKQEVVKQEVVKQEVVKQEVVKQEVVKQEVVKQEVVKQEGQWVKVSGTKKEGAPTGTKKIPVMEELAPAEEFLNLAQYEGKVVYLDFWASWCVPCRDSFPFMNQVQEKFKDDLVVVAVNLDEEKANAEKFLEAYPANFEIVYDQFWQAGRAYGIYGLPFSFVYNRKGELVGKHGGFKDGDEINLAVALQNLIDTGE